MREREAVLETLTITGFPFEEVEGVKIKIKK
jgi:hypothetical protein